MTGFMILGLTALAALSALLFCYRLADSNLRATSALASARAVVEQIRTLDYGALGQPTLPVDVPSSAAGVLTAGAWNSRLEDIHNTPGNTADDLQLSLRPELTRVVGEDGTDRTQVILRFRWEETALLRRRMREDALVLVVAPVPAY
jgi:hypothetical protein